LNVLTKNSMTLPIFNPFFLILSLIWAFKSKKDEKFIKKTTYVASNKKRNIV
jgi:hypothetical protein